MSMGANRRQYLSKSNTVMCTDVSLHFIINLILNRYLNNITSDKYRPYMPSLAFDLKPLKSDILPLKCIQLSAVNSLGFALCLKYLSFLPKRLYILSNLWAACC
jgi:hypothetical protein